MKKKLISIFDHWSVGVLPSGVSGCLMRTWPDEMLPYETAIHPVNDRRRRGLNLHDPYTCGKMFLVISRFSYKHVPNFLHTLWAQFLFLQATAGAPRLWATSGASCQRSSSVRLERRCTMGSPGASAIKKLSGNAGDVSFRSLGWEEPLEKEMTTHSSLCEIPRTEEPGGLQPKVAKSQTWLSN